MILLNRRMKRWALWGGLVGMILGIASTLPSGGGDWYVLLPALLIGLAVGLVLGALAGRYWDRSPKI